MRQPTKEDLHALKNRAAQEAQKLGAKALERAKADPKTTAEVAAGLVLAYLFYPPEDASLLGNLARMLCFLAAMILLHRTIQSSIASDQPFTASDQPLQMTDGPGERKKFEAANVASLSGRTFFREEEMDRLAREAQTMMAGVIPKK